MFLFSSSKLRGQVLQTSCRTKYHTKMEYNLFYISLFFGWSLQLTWFKDAVFYHQNLTRQISTCLCTCYSLSVQINSVKSLPYMCIWTYKSKNFIPGKRLYAVCSCFTIDDDMTSAYGVYKFWLSSGQKTTVHVMLMNET